MTRQLAADKVPSQRFGSEYCYFPQPCQTEVFRGASMINDRRGQPTIHCERRSGLSGAETIVWRTLGGGAIGGTITTAGNVHD
jgi:hypothetical protein